MGEGTNSRHSAQQSSPREIGRHGPSEPGTPGSVLTPTRTEDERVHPGRRRVCRRPTLNVLETYIDTEIKTFPLPVRP